MMRGARALRAMADTDQDDVTGRSRWCEDQTDSGKPAGHPLQACRQNRQNEHSEPRVIGTRSVGTRISNGSWRGTTRMTALMPRVCRAMVAIDKRIATKVLEAAMSSRHNYE